MNDFLYHDTNERVRMKREGGKSTRHKKSQVIKPCVSWLFQVSSGVPCLKHLGSGPTCFPFFLSWVSWQFYLLSSCLARNCSWLFSTMKHLITTNWKEMVWRTDFHHQEDFKRRVSYQLKLFVSSDFLYFILIKNIRFLYPWREGNFKTLLRRKNGTAYDVSRGREGRELVVTVYHLLSISKSRTSSLVSSVPLRLPTAHTRRVSSARILQTTPPLPPLSKETKLRINSPSFFFHSKEHRG